RANASLLRQWLADARVGFAASPAGSGVTVLDFQTRGFAGAELSGLECSGRPGARAALKLDKNRNGIVDLEDPVVPGAWQGDRFVPANPLALLAAWHTGQPYRDGRPGLTAGTQHYRLFLSEAGGGCAAVRPELVNRHTQQRVE